MLSTCPRIPSGIELQCPTEVTSLIMPHLALPSLPTLQPAWASQNHLQANDFQPNPCLKVCFWKSQRHTHTLLTLACFDSYCLSLGGTCPSFLKLASLTRLTLFSAFASHVDTMSAVNLPRPVAGVRRLSAAPWPHPGCRHHHLLSVSSFSVNSTRQRPHAIHLSAF